MLKKAISLAEKAHHGQVDKGGHPYIGPPERVMKKCETTEEKIVAILHDVMEDTDYTAEDLRREGFSEEILGALLYLTHRDGENYMEYIERICENPLAVKVKYADLQDNMNLSRIPEPTEKDLARLEKYKLAKKRIEEAMKG